MSEPAIASPVDLAALPREFEGKWVLIRVTSDGQQVISSGDNPSEAMRGQASDDPSLLLTAVPRECPITVVRGES